MTSYRLFPMTNGPATPTDFGPGFEWEPAIGFTVTQETVYFEGYWWWVCPTLQPTAAQKFCLWQDTANFDNAGAQGVVIADSVVTSGPLVAGQWNFVPLPQPIPLTQYISYRAATAVSRYGPTTNGQFGAGGPYATGITNGPLFAYADSSSGNSSDVSFFSGNNASWNEGTLDPTTVYPGRGSQGFNAWMDVQVTDQVPAGATFRCWPNQPSTLYTPEIALPFTVSTQLAASEPAKVLNVWFMSQPGNQMLPSICGIWDTATQSVVPGSVFTSPTWALPHGGAGTPGAGWLVCDYSATGIVLQPNHNYRVAVGMYQPNYIWYSGAQGYWLANGGGYPSQGLGAAHGAGNGIISCVPCGLSPNPLSPCAQDTSGGWAYPNSVESDGDNYYLDLEVAPSSSGTGGPGSSPNTSGSFLVFFL